MGFSTGLLILSPFTPKDAPHQMKCWRPSELINIGYSYRSLQQLSRSQPHYISDRSDSKSRAGVVTFSHIYLKLCEIFRTSKARDIFAPPFVPIVADKRSYFSWGENKEFWQTVSPDEEFIFPFHLYSDEMYPSLNDQKRHNVARNVTDAELEACKAEHDLIVSDPMLWITCRKMSLWLEAFMTPANPSWTQILRDREAKARVEGWHAQFRAYSKIHARVLFVHESVTWP